jgi:hypothetical protein
LQRLERSFHVWRALQRIVARTLNGTINGLAAKALANNQPISMFVLAALNKVRGRSY